MSNDASDRRTLDLFRSAAARRSRVYRESLRRDGLRQVLVVVPEARVEEIKGLAREYVAQARGGSSGEAQREATQGRSRVPPRPRGPGIPRDSR